MNLILQGVYAFLACIFFAYIFQAPRNELVYCGAAGGAGWFVYELVTLPINQPVVATFLAAIVVTAVSRFLSHVRRAPSTIYLIPGIIPLVPGAGLYYTMYSILNNDLATSYTKGVYTLKVAGVIALGIILVLSLPYSVFNFIKLKD